MNPDAVRFVARLVLIASCVVSASCAPVYVEKQTSYTPAGQVEENSLQLGGRIISELRREFQEVVFVGRGSIENANEGLARRAATQLALAELAGKVESRVRSSTTIANAKDVRDVIETRVAVLVQNYEIQRAGYDEDGTTYVVEVSLTGEGLVGELERELLP